MPSGWSHETSSETPGHWEPQDILKPLQRLSQSHCCSSSSFIISRHSAVLTRRQLCCSGATMTSICEPNFGRPSNPSLWPRIDNSIRPIGSCLGLDKVYNSSDRFLFENGSTALLRVLISILHSGSVRSERIVVLESV